MPPIGRIAAVPACQCWCAEVCSYTDTLPGPPHRFYFNAGLLVFRPSRDEFKNMQITLNTVTGEYPFAEQDFLNKHFAGRVMPLPSAFNALKFAFVNNKHSKDINMDTCIALHFVMAKPWDKAAACEEEFTHLHQLWQGAWAKHEQMSVRWLDWLQFSAPGPPAGCLYYVPDYPTAEVEKELLQEIHKGEGKDSNS